MHLVIAAVGTSMSVFRDFCAVDLLAKAIHVVRAVGKQSFDHLGGWYSAFARKPRISVDVDSAHFAYMTR